jgi:hypothetical protein
MLYYEEANTSANCRIKVFRGHIIALMLLGYFEGRVPKNLEGNICSFLLGVATKTCDKTQELPLEDAII